MFALTITSVLDILFVSYRFWAPTVVIPLVASLFVRRPRAAAALSAMLGGGALVLAYTIAFYLGAVERLAPGWPDALRNNFGLAAGVTANLVTYVAVHLALSRREPRPTTSAA